jgi:hypothetical protein
MLLGAGAILAATVGLVVYGMIQTGSRRTYQEDRERDEDRQRQANERWEEVRPKTLGEKFQKSLEEARRKKEEEENKIVHDMTTNMRKSAYKGLLKARMDAKSETMRELGVEPDRRVDLAGYRSWWERCDKHYHRLYKEAVRSFGITEEIANSILAEGGSKKWPEPEGYEYP